MHYYHVNITKYYLVNTHTIIKSAHTSIRSMHTLFIVATFFNNVFFLYQQCFEEVERPFDEVLGRDRRMNRDDWSHGSLLVVNELLRCSNVEGEVRTRKL